jgi:hypothetical protein
VTPNGLIWTGAAFWGLTMLGRGRVHEDTLFTATVMWCLLFIAGDAWLLWRDVRSGDVPAAAFDALLLAAVLAVLWVSWRRWRKGKRRLRDALGAKSRALRDALVRKSRESAQPRPVRVPS